MPVSFARKFRNTPIPEIVQILKNIPANETYVSLSDNDFANRPVPHIAAILNALPPAIKLIHCLELRYLSFNNSLQLSRLIPQRFHSLLSNFGSKIKDVPTEQIIQALQTLPEWETEIDLSHSDLNKRPLPEILAIIAAIPPTVKNVKFKWSGLEQLDNQAKSQLLKAAPSRFQLKLSNYYWKFPDLPTEQIIQILKTLPPEETELNVSYNDLGNRPLPEILAIMAAIPSTIKKVDFRNNLCQRLYIKDARQIINETIEILKAIPKHVTLLRLGSHKGYTTAAAEAPSVLEADTVWDMSQGILFDCHFVNSTFSVDDSLKIIDAIPEHISSLEITEGGFDHAQLCQILNLLSKKTHITALDFRSLHLNVMDFCKQIPPNIHTLVLGEEEITSYSDEKIKQLGQALPYVANVVVVNARGEPSANPKAKLLSQYAGSAVECARQNITQQITDAPVSIVMEYAGFFSTEKQYFDFKNTHAHNSSAVGFLPQATSSFSASSSSSSSSSAHQMHPTVGSSSSAMPVKSAHFFAATETPQKMEEHKDEKQAYDLSWNNPNVS